MLSGKRKGGSAVRILTAVAGDREAGRAVRAAVPHLFSLGTHEFRRLKQQGGILVNGRPSVRTASCKRATGSRCASKARETTAWRTLRPRKPMAAASDTSTAI